MCHYVPQRPAHRSRTVSHVSFKWMLNCVGLIIDFSISTDTHLSISAALWRRCFLFHCSVTYCDWLLFIIVCVVIYYLCVSHLVSRITKWEQHGLHNPSGSERHKSPLGSGQEGLVSNSNMQTCYCEPVGQAESSFSPHWCDRWTLQI